MSELNNGTTGFQPLPDSTFPLASPQPTAPAETPLPQSATAASTGDDVITMGASSPEPTAPSAPPPFVGNYPPPFGAAGAPPVFYSPVPPAGTPQQPYYAYQPPGYPAGQPYRPYASFQTPKKKTNGFLKGLAIVVGSVLGIVLFAAAVVLLSRVVSSDDFFGTSRPGLTSDPGYSNSLPPLPGGEDDTASAPTTSGPQVDLGENADPNGPSLKIFSLPADTSLTLDAKEIAAKFKPSVVSISVYFNEGKPSVETQYGEGTGIVMTANGYILTNSHVVRDSSARQLIIVVTTSAQREYTAKVVGVDPRTDLAVLKIDATDLTPAEFGDSTKLNVGETLVAIGNGGGIKFAGSVTQGIVSAVDRKIDSDLEGAMKYIQTDAAINPGNSGGPLINEFGQVIGVNTAKISGDGFENMGFAIPTSAVKPVVDDLLHFGYVTGRARLGVTCENYSLYETSGVTILDFSADSDFHNTEARKGDIIAYLDGQRIRSLSDVYAVVNNHKPGDVIKVKLSRATLSGRAFPPADDDELDTGKYIEVSVKLLADLGETQIALVTPTPNYDPYEDEYPVE